MLHSYLLRTMKSDIPDAEIEAYGSNKKIEESFDCPASDINEEDKEIAKEFVDDFWEEIYALDWPTQIYYSLSTFEYEVK